MGLGEEEEIYSQTDDLAQGQTKFEPQDVKLIEDLFEHSLNIRQRNN